MNKTAYRILDILSQRIGISMSVNEITREMGKIYGCAHYADNYKMIKKLDSEQIVTLGKSGRSLLVLLNFDNPLIQDILAEMELKRKRDFLKGKQEMQMLLQDTCVHMRNILLFSNMLLTYPEKNTRLNKAEIIINLKECDDKKTIETTKIQICTTTERLQRLHNIRIDHLTLESRAFSTMIKSNEHNPIREMLHSKIAILHPQDFWLTIKDTVESGFRISPTGLVTSPPKIPDEDIVFNLARFGYVELGSVAKQGRLFCIEYVIASIMFHGDARRIGAVPVIMVKNPTINYDLLLFLARKYGFCGILLGILRALRDLVAHKMKTIDEPIMILESMKTKEVKADAKNIRERLSLYNAT